MNTNKLLPVRGKDLRQMAEGLVPGAATFNAMTVQQAMPFVVDYDLLPQLNRTAPIAVIKPANCIKGDRAHYRVVARLKKMPPAGTLLDLAKSAFNLTLLFCREPVNYAGLQGSFNSAYKLHQDPGSLTGRNLIGSLARHTFANMKDWHTYTCYMWSDKTNMSAALAALQRVGLEAELPVINNARQSALEMWIRHAYFGFPTRDIKFHVSEDPYEFSSPAAFANLWYYRVIGGCAHVYWKVPVHPDNLAELTSLGDLLLYLRWDPTRGEQGYMKHMALLRVIYPITPDTPRKMGEDNEFIASIGGERCEGHQVALASQHFLLGSDHLSLGDGLAKPRLLPDRRHVLDQFSSFLHRPDQDDLCLGDLPSGQPMTVVASENPAILVSGATQSGKTKFVERLLAVHPLSKLKSFTYFALGTTADDPIFRLIGSNGGKVLEPNASYRDPATYTEFKIAAKELVADAERQFNDFLAAVKAGTAHYPLGIKKVHWTYGYYAFAAKILELTRANLPLIAALNGGGHVLVFDDYQSTPIKDEDPDKLGSGPREVGMAIINIIQNLGREIRHQQSAMILVDHDPKNEDPVLVNQCNLRIDIPDGDRMHCTVSKPSMEGLVLTEDLNIYLPPEVLQAFLV